MLQRLSMAEFLGCLIEHIEGNTGLRCYDDPNNKDSPFYSVQLVRSEPADTKTMYVDTYEVWVHCISAPTVPYSTSPVLALVQSLEEAMSESVAVPSGYKLVSQTYGGLQSIKEDESHEGHAVLSFEFRICYGFRCK